MIELYDVGRVILGPFKEGYRFIAEEGRRYISDRVALEKVIQFHKNRKTPIDQKTFDLLNHAWVQAYEKGELEIDLKKLVYDDVQPRFELVRARGDKVILLTSGSEELIDAMLGTKVVYDGLYIGSKVGDKNLPDTYAGIWERSEGQIKAFYDDKPVCLMAAYQGFDPKKRPALFLVDRLNLVDDTKVSELHGMGIVKITGFNQIRD